MSNKWTAGLPNNALEPTVKRWWAASGRGIGIVAGRSTQSLERTVIAALDAPPRVRTAIILLWVSVLISLILALAYEPS